MHVRCCNRVKEKKLSVVQVGGDPSHRRLFQLLTIETENEFLVSGRSFPVHDKPQLYTYMHARMCIYTEIYVCLHSTGSQDPSHISNPGCLIHASRSGLKLCTGASQPSPVSPQPLSNCLRENYNTH